MKILIASIAVALVIAGSAMAGGPTRLDISPAALMYVGAGHGGQFMGGAVTGDLLFNRGFGLRTTIGFTKNRYYPHALDYADADYGFWLSIAPYAEMSFAGTVRPYLAVLGTFSSGPADYERPWGPDTHQLAPVNRIQGAQNRATAYSFGATIGTKLNVGGPVALYAELTHYFFTSVSPDRATFDNGVPDIAFNYAWDRTPTYLSVGLTYSVSLKKAAE